MSAVLALIILVAAFTVVATLIMIVLEKKKEIAVLKAMGATTTPYCAHSFTRVAHRRARYGDRPRARHRRVQASLVYAFPLDPKVYFISQLPVE